MLRLSDLQLPLDHTDDDLHKAIISTLHITEDELLGFTLFKRSFDARKKHNIKLIYQFEVALTDTAEQRVLEQFANQSFVRPSPDTSYQFVAEAAENFPVDTQQRPIVIGFGPCGMLAALVLAQMGLKPIVLERGQDVRQRTKDTWGLWREGKLNTESNVQYGEGGAGTFSDGKLYSQVKDKRHLGRKVLTEFVKAGAPEEIMYVSKPHIGTFKLVAMVENIRNEIIELGGEIRFGCKVETIHRKTFESEASGSESLGVGNGQITGVTLSTGETLESLHIILAIGHSARDSFKMLLEQGVYIEPKPFSIGFRIEHPQSVIDKARFGEQAGHPILGAADYKLVHHCKNGRSVYSFCMCPGGTVVAATSEEGSVVTNGMSQYSRNERNANSAIVVGIEPEKDYPEHPLAGIDLQRKLEALAYQLGGENYYAPAQLVGDFLEGRPSTKLGTVTPYYTPSVTLGDLSQALPEFLIFIVGQFGDIWAGRMARARAVNAYLADRLSILTKNHFLLKISHERLENDLLMRPTTLRTALLQLRQLTLASQDTTTLLPGAAQLVQFVAHACQLESAALYAFRDGKLIADPFAEVGTSFSLSSSDALVQACLDTKSLTHLQTASIREGLQSEYVACVPLLSGAEDVIGVLVVKQMPFLSLTEENLQLLLMLVGYYADGANPLKSASKILAEVPSCPQDFALDYVRLMRLGREAGMASTLAALTFGPGDQQEMLCANVRRGLRALDVSWRIDAEDNLCLLILMPLTGKDAFSAYLLRAESNLQRQFDLDFAKAHITFRSMHISGQASDETLKNFFQKIQVDV